MPLRTSASSCAPSSPSACSRTRRKAALAVAESPAIDGREPGRNSQRTEERSGRLASRRASARRAAAGDASTARSASTRSAVTAAVGLSRWAWLQRFQGARWIAGLETRAAQRLPDGRDRPPRAPRRFPGSVRPTRGGPRRPARPPRCDRAAAAGRRRPIPRSPCPARGQRPRAPPSYCLRRRSEPPGWPGAAPIAGLSESGAAASTAAGRIARRRRRRRPHSKSAMSSRRSCDVRHGRSRARAAA